MATAVRDKRSLAELTQAFFGEALMVNQVFERLELEPWSAGRADDPAPRETAGEQLLWVGSIGYEHYRVNTDFAAQLSRMGVERLIDVRQLPISRRRGYAKTALGAALAAEGIEYAHMRGLGNPKPTRDLYKSGHTAEGRAGYEEYLLGEQRGALVALAELLSQRRCALMCVEHDSSVCHRDVIFCALRSELGLELDVAEIG
jgi:uncharacterized protein (DUF488 family)